MKEYSMWTSDKEVKKGLKAQAKKDAKRFCRRNRIYNTYDESVAKLIEKLYVTTYLRAFHQQSTEVKTLMSKRSPNNFKVMKTESFRCVSDKPNIEEIPRECYVDPRGYKSWDELTLMDKAIYKLIGGRLINCYWDKRNPTAPMTPVIREIDDQRNRNINDRITYVVDSERINVWYFGKDEGHSKIKEVNLRTEGVKNYIREHL